MWNIKPLQWTTALSFSPTPQFHDLCQTFLEIVSSHKQILELWNQDPRPSLCPSPGGEQNSELWRVPETVQCSLTYKCKHFSTVSPPLSFLFSPPLTTPPHLSVLPHQRSPLPGADLLPSASRLWVSQPSEPIHLGPSPPCPLPPPAHHPLPPLPLDFSQNLTHLSCHLPGSDNLWPVKNKAMFFMIISQRKTRSMFIYCQESSKLGLFN